MIGLKMIAWDGSEWDLQTGAVRAAKGGIQGLNHVPVETFTRETALVDGQQFTGWRAKPRPMLLPVLIGQAVDDKQWLKLSRAWWRTMRHNKTNRYVVTAPDGTYRWIDARFENDGNDGYDHDPSMDRLEVAVLSLIADDPWWKSGSIEATFLAGVGNSNYFGGAAGLATPYVISPSSTRGDRVIDNPGDVEAWPVYRIDGPTTEFSAIIDGHPVGAPITVLANQQLTINTAPDQQTAHMMTGGRLDENGVRIDGVRTSVMKQISDVAFRPIPPESSAQLNVTINGTGKITLAAAPKYFRAW